MNFRLPPRLPWTQRVPGIACRVNGSSRWAQAVERAGNDVPPLHSFQSADLTPPLPSGQPDDPAPYNPTAIRPCVGFPVGLAVL